MTTAPAAADTLAAHFSDTGKRPGDYDIIASGDLGLYGKELCVSLCAEAGIKLGDNYIDCGCEIFGEEQDVKAGGSGCGCSAALLNSWLLGMLEKGDIRSLLFMATGALMNPQINQQGESIPGVAHAVALERV